VKLLGVSEAIQGAYAPGSFDYSSLRDGGIVPGLRIARITAGVVPTGPRSRAGRCTASARTP
jgi:hypothetical protein